MVVAAWLGRSSEVEEELLDRCRSRSAGGWQAANAPGYFRSSTHKHVDFFKFIKIVDYGTVALFDVLNHFSGLLKIGRIASNLTSVWPFVRK